MKLTKICFLLIPCFCIFSCKKEDKKNETERIVKEWAGKSIQFPEAYQCSFSGKDTLPELCIAELNAEYKILLYVDSAGCSECRLKLFEWKRLIAESDSLFGEKLSFLFFFQPKSKKEISDMLKRDRFDYPVFIDENNQINSLNHFPDKPELQCFLLDKYNKVLLIGNPVLNPKVWELYKQTCGCTVPVWEKQPVEQGGETEIRLEIQPEETGVFHKTVSVYGNVKDGVIKVAVKGTTK
ncbi:MAG: DUF1573 domain-containing protein [Dysgonamonadaceae bacterium]|jgi:hypothetical protein|nr:DUF1573 domain-containing protein [Dysgonamonadaceae bacterium]